MGALMRTPSISRPGGPPDRCRRCGSACPRWWCGAAKTTCRDWHHNWVHRNRLAVSSPIYDETHFCVLAKPLVLVRAAGTMEDESTVDRRRRRKRSPSALAPVSYTHLRAHETVLDLVCRLLLEKKK